MSTIFSTVKLHSILILHNRYIVQVSNYSNKYCYVCIAPHASAFAIAVAVSPFTVTPYCSCSCSTHCTITSIILSSSSVLILIMIYLTFCFVLLSVLSFYPFVSTFYFCRTGFRGDKQAKSCDDIPLLEILRPLPPVPEQWHFYPQF